MNPGGTERLCGNGESLDVASDPPILEFISSNPWQRQVAVDDDFRVQEMVVTTLPELTK